MTDLVLWSDHALARAKERIGIEPDRDEQVRILFEITDRRVPVLCREPTDGREHYIVAVRGVPVRIVYCPQTACVVTVLPDFRRQRRAW